MARSPRRDDEDAPDPVEAADEPAEGEQDDLDGFRDVDPEAEDDLDFDDAGGGGGSDLADDLDDDLDDEVVDDALVDDLPDPDDLPVILSDEDELAAVVAAAEDDEDDDSLREGEFVCRSCFMAKRESALADPDAMLCRDCM